MKTIFIYDQCCQDDIKFFIVPGDYSHLDGTYINAEDEANPDELLSILYDIDCKVFLQELLPHFPVKELTPATKVITVGWLP